MRVAIALVLVASCAGSKAPGCPEGAVAVNGKLCVDRTEVTVAAYDRCVAAGACTLAAQSPTGNGSKDAVIAQLGPLCNGGKADRKQHPINCVSWSQADTYCRWAKGRLPSEAEWELAARGPQPHTYPWGEDPPSPERVNACDSSCAALFERTFGKRPAPMFEASDGYEATAPVGSFPRGASPCGALDMAGNVDEWVSDWYEVDKMRSYRGGGWDLGTVEKLATSYRDAAPPDVKSVIIGFRCVYQP
jgi:formylglycine-generating enzyme required for sulfatase activity